MLRDAEGVGFLQWCLPQLRLRWPGFRKVRRQVFKRINRRIQELGLPDLAAYRIYIRTHPDEWPVLDKICWIGISRFYRDRSVFRYLEEKTLPFLAERLVARGDSEFRCWSVGCAGGEEPYTLSVIWRQRLAMQFPTLRLWIVATDIDARAIHRAKQGCYRPSSLKELPNEWLGEAFTRVADKLCLKDEYGGPVVFMVQDIREQAPDGPFQLILCRNLVFTYFDEQLQRNTIQKLVASLAPGGALIIGKLESIPDGPWGIEPWSARSGIYRKSPETQRN